MEKEKKSVELKCLLYIKYFYITILYLNMNFSTIILAAGKSSRMGVPKWSLAYDAQSTFLQHIIEVCHHAGSQEIIVILNANDEIHFRDKFPELPSYVKIVINRNPDWERYYSLKLGIDNLSAPNTVLMCPIDNPAIEIPLIHTLFNAQDDSYYVYPTFKNKGGHPILLSQKLVEKIKQSNENTLHLKTFLESHTLKAVEVESENILLNINNFIDYEEFIKRKKDNLE